MTAPKYDVPMIQCSACQTPYVARFGISLKTSEYHLAWYPDCKHRGSRPDYVVVGGDDPKWFDASDLGITSRRSRVRTRVAS